MVRPNTFIVGAQKSATTSLHHYLSDHPDVFSCDEKEPNFFNTDHHEESDDFHGKQLYFDCRSESDYLNMFSNHDGEKIVEEASVAYLRSREAAENIYEFDSDANIIIILREPVSMLKSLHSQLLMINSEEETNFRKAYELSSQRRQWKKVPPNVRTPSFLDYKMIGSYDQHVKRYVNRFDDVKILIFEDFVSDIESKYKEVLEFLEIDTSFTPSFQKYNKRERPVFQWVNKIVKSSAWRDRLKRLGLYETLYPVGKWIADLNIREVDDDKLDEVVRQELMKDMKDSVVKLNKYVETDVVEKWGYDEV